MLWLGLFASWASELSASGGTGLNQTGRFDHVNAGGRNETISSLDRKMPGVGNCYINRDQVGAVAATICEAMYCLYRP